MKKQNVSDAVIRRLPRYYRYLDDLHAKGVVRISSSSLGAKMGITASQIRQDLSCFGEFGQQGYGYNVEELRSEIGHILGVDNHHKIIVVGVGNLGHALMQNFHFGDIGFTLEAAFDISPQLIGTQVAGVPVLDLAELDQYVRENRPDVAVLTVPQQVAQATVDRLMTLGVRGFWNFTNVELSSEGQNVRIEDEPLSAAMDRMEKACLGILNEVEQHPEKAAQVRRFANYYVQDAVKILTLYAELEEKGVQGENAAGVRAEVAQNAQTIATAFENQLDSLFARDALDISTDLEVLNGMLKGQGLVD